MPPSSLSGGPNLEGPDDDAKGVRLSPLAGVFRATDLYWPLGGTGKRPGRRNSGPERRLGVAVRSGIAGRAKIGENSDSQKAFPYSDCAL